MQPVRRRAAPQAKPQRGFAGLPFRTDDIGVAVGDEYKGAGAAHDGQIVFCIGPCFGADTDEGEDRVHKEQEQGRHQNAYAHTAPHTERADLFGVVIPAFAQGTGDHRSAADAEHRSYRHKQQKDRRGKGDRSHLQVVVGLPDEKSVCEVVDQHHKHGGHGNGRAAHIADKRDEAGRQKLKDSAQRNDAGIFGAELERIPSCAQQMQER